MKEQLEILTRGRLGFINQLVQFGRINMARFYFRSYIQRDNANATWLQCTHRSTA